MPTTARKRDCLTCAVRERDCFCHLPTDALTSLQTTGRRFHLRKGERLLYEGDKADQVYLVCAGHLKLMASSTAGRMLILRLARPGDVLGLSAALRRGVESLTAEALEPTEVKALPRTEFFNFIDRFRPASSNAARSAAVDFEDALISARRLALSGSATGRMAALLLDLAHQEHGDDALSASKDFALPLTHEDLGNMAGISRETVTRTLAQFRRDHLIAQQPGRMTLLQPARLTNLFS